jgi:hypothetical protein
VKKGEESKTAALRFSILPVLSFLTRFMTNETTQLETPSDQAKSIAQDTQRETRSILIDKLLKAYALQARDVVRCGWQFDRDARTRGRFQRAVSVTCVKQRAATHLERDG